MKEVVLADKYAKALVACAREADLIDQLDIELTMFEGILAKQVKLREILLNPVIPVKEKSALLELVFKKGWASQELMSFLFLLLEKRRFNLFRQICQIYKDLIYSLRRKLKVFVESAFTLGASEKTALKERLARAYRRDIDLSVRTNPELIGGARVYAGHRLYDGTVQARLVLLRNQMKGLEWRE